MAARRGKRQVSALGRKDKAHVFTGVSTLAGMILGFWIVVLIAWGLWALLG